MFEAKYKNIAWCYKDNMLFPKLNIGIYIFKQNKLLSW